MEEESIKKMKALLYAIFELVDLTGITIHITKNGTLILSDENAGYNREITKEGLEAIQEDYWNNLRK